MANRVLFLKSVATILSIATMCLGVYSHFTSDWVKPVEYKTLTGKGKMSAYQICDSPFFDAFRDYYKCPSIWLDRAFIIIIVLSCAGSVISLLVTIACKPISGSCCSWMERIFYLIFAAFLLGTAIAYIVATEQIQKLDAIFSGMLPFFHAIGNFRRTERIIASALAMLQSVLYGAITSMVC